MTKKIITYFLVFLFTLNINLNATFASPSRVSGVRSHFFTSAPSLRRASFVASSSALNDFVNALPFRLTHSTVYGALALLFIFGVGIAFGGVLTERKYARAAKRAARTNPAPAKTETAADKCPPAADVVAEAPGTARTESEDNQEESKGDDDDEESAPQSLNRSSLDKQPHFIDSYIADNIYVCLLDKSFRVIQPGDKVIHLLGRPREEIVGQPILELLRREENRRMLHDFFQDFDNNFGAVTFNHQFFFEPGYAFTVTEMDADESGVQNILAVGINISDSFASRKEAFYAADVERYEYKLAISGGDVGLIRYLPTTGVIEMSASGAQMLEHDCDEPFFTSLEHFESTLHPEDAGLLESYLMDDAQQTVDASFEIELRVRTEEGPYRWFLFKFSYLYDSFLGSSIFTGAFINIDNMKKFEYKMNLLAFRDSVTKTLNKPKLMIETERILADVTRQGLKAYVFFIDIDSFKSVNSQKGDGIGDRLLREVASYLQRQLPEGAVLGRPSGDEFVVVGTYNGSDEKPPELCALIERLQASVSTIVAGPFGLNTVSFCAGVSIFPKDGANSATLFEQASLALIAAKENGKGSLRFYDQEIIDNIKKRERLKADMQTPDFFDQLELYYQPKVEAVSGRVIGAEALIRWNHPDYGLVQPNTFIVLAEQTGIISDIDWWCLQECCQQVIRWQLAGYHPIQFSVNISANILYDEDMVTKIEALIQRTGISPKYLDLELTERMTVQHLDLSSARLEQIRALGVTISIDDFGTGYSSLNYLHRLPADYIKIDRSFISELDADPYVQVIVTTLINLSKELGMSTVAEGVETDFQRDFVVQAGCDYIQGYYFGRPARSKDFETNFLLRTENASTD